MPSTIFTGKPNIIADYIHRTHTGMASSDSSID